MYLAPDGDELEIASAAATYLAAMPIERLQGADPADMATRALGDCPRRAGGGRAVVGQLENLPGRPFW